MNLRRILSFILLIAALRLSAQEQISLNGTWDFALAKTGEEALRLENFHAPEFTNNDFKPIPIPSNWAVLGYEEPVYRGFKEDTASEGFYLHTFTVPKDWNEKRVLLHFGGVWSSAEVWLNGQYLGRHDSGYTSFSFNATGKLKTDNINRLAVRVRQVTREYKFDVFDDWTLGGIYRDVTLEAMPAKRWIDNVVAQTTFDNYFKDADLKVRVMVSDKHKNTLPGNYPSPGEPYNLRFTLSDKEGQEVARQQITIPAHTSTDRETDFTLRILSPLHWTAETPNLYNLRIDLLEKGQVAHTRTERIGFRQISTTGGVFRINGQAVKLRGVNRHDEHPDVGRATTRAHWLQDITLMKAANINYIRLSHYTPAKGFIELCDEMGMYVGNEISLGGAGNLMYDPSFSNAVLQRSYETVVRDINSPSVIYWSIGNEDPLTTLHMASVKSVKALDPTRPVLLPWRHEEWLPKEVDILAPHYWKDREYAQLASHSDRPIISTEYTHAYGIDGFGGLEARWKALTKHPAGTGAAIWMWADQGIKTPVAKAKYSEDDISQGDKYLRIDYAGWDGIVDSYRNLTRDYLETKAVYAQIYPAIDKMYFVPGQDSIRIPIQNDFDFTNLNTVKINWSIWEDGQELSSGNSSINGQPHATSALKLPISKLKTIQPGKTYFIRFIFTRADGSEITREAVELCPQTEQIVQAVSNGKLIVSKDKESVIVATNDIRYIFNPRTGQLTSADIQGKQMITDLRPVIWRTLDRSETSAFGKENVRKAVDLNKYTQSVKSWKIEESEGNVVIKTEVNYTVDTNNRFTTTYRYTIGADGHLDISYQILTNVAIPWLPIVGMAVQSASELNQLHWLGLGPCDAYPNKQAAPILGLWGGKAGSTETTGIKATRWIERTGAIGCLRIASIGYMEHNASRPETMYILSGVFARPEKGRKAEESVPQLSTDTGKPFVGEFSITLRANQK